jgi:hypothetical protein
LTIAVLGTVMYVYLRKEQDKLSPAYKGDETEIEFTKKTRVWEFLKELSVLLSSFKNNFFANRLVRFATFAGTYIAAMILTLIVLGVFVHPVIPFFLIFFFMVSIPEFPLGLYRLLTNQFDTYLPNEITLIIYIVLIYLSISLLATITTNRRLLTFLYILFVALLIMNIAGCSISAPLLMSKIN